MPDAKKNEAPLAKKRCIPCEGNVSPMLPEKAQEMMAQLDPEWMLIDEAHLLARSFRFKDFAQTMVFVNKIAAIAEAEGHHPDLTITYGAAVVELMTHAIGGLSENDYIVAAKIDELE